MQLPTELRNVKKAYHPGRAHTSSYPRVRFNNDWGIISAQKFLVYIEQGVLPTCPIEH